MPAAGQITVVTVIWPPSGAALEGWGKGRGQAADPGLPVG
jgi:hypothetical protein